MGKTFQDRSASLREGDRVPSLKLAKQIQFLRDQKMIFAANWSWREGVAVLWSVPAPVGARLPS